MHELTEADKILIEQVRMGREEGWRQLVDRYQGRLLAFARSKLKQPSDAEDLVQDTFIAFLNSPSQFRGESSLETFLFVILRRKIVDAYRSPKMNLCLLQDIMPPSDDSTGHDPGIDRLAAPDPTASWYARQKEDRTLRLDTLASALQSLIAGLKKNLNFRDLQIIEMIFYCQLRNKDIARLIAVDEKQIAVIKHRAIKQIQDDIRTSAPQPQTDPTEINDGLISEIWQQNRLSCLKRSTIGSYLLGTLEKPWHDYVAFHLDQLGCRFCRANFDDLQHQVNTENTATLRNRILQSTVGFLSKS